MNNERKSIIPVDLVDIHSITPRAEEMITSEVIGYSNSININPSLLSDSDPAKEEYLKFLMDMGNSPIIITNEDIGIDDSKSYYDDIDFSNSLPVTSKTYNLQTGKDSYTHNNLWANSIFNSTIFPACGFGYATPTPMNKSVEIESRKISGVKTEFMRLGTKYEPQQLAGINSLSIAK